eukprot:1054834-Prymnesium_polylepis.1
MDQQATTQREAQDDQLGTRPSRLHVRSARAAMPSGSACRAQTARARGLRHVFSNSGQHKQHASSSKRLAQATRAR